VDRASAEPPAYLPGEALATRYELAGPARRVLPVAVDRVAPLVVPIVGALLFAWAGSSLRAVLPKAANASAWRH